MNNIGTVNGGMVGGSPFRTPAAPLRMNDAAIASGGAFLSSELEKRDNLIRKPLTSFTYPRDIPVKTGGGWVESISALNIGFGVTGGSGDGSVHASGATDVPMIQASFGKDTFKCHTFAVGMRIMFVDMQRSELVGRSLDQILTEGIRLTYDKHMDQNVYMGLNQYGTHGLLNLPAVTATNVASSGAGNSTKWKDKTPQQILDDVNRALTDTWAAAEYDRSAVPNHIVMPHEQYIYIATTKVTELATETIYEFLMKNNAASKEGAGLFIGGASWCKGAGVGSTDRMAVYVHNERFLAVEELEPLRRVMTQPNAGNLCYDTGYLANLSEVEVFYPQTMRYCDGI